MPAAGAPILAARGRDPPPASPRRRVRRRRAGEESLGPGYEWAKADRRCLGCGCPLCRLGAAPRTSAGRCRCLASRLLGPPLRAARRLRAHAREGALARSQPRAPRPSPPPAPRSRPFSHGQSAPRRGRGGGGAARHEDMRSQSQRAPPPPRPRLRAGSPPPPCGSRGSRAHPAGMQLGSQEAWDRDAPRLGRSPPLHLIQACPRLDGGRRPWEPKVALDRLWAFG